MPSLEQTKQARRIVADYRRGDTSLDNTLKRLRLRGFTASDFRDMLASLEAADRDAQQQTAQEPANLADHINGLFREHHHQMPGGQHQDRNDQMNQWVRRVSGR